MSAWVSKDNGIKNDTDAITDGNYFHGINNIHIFL